MCTGGKHFSRRSSGGQGLISEALAGLSASWRLQREAASLPLNFWSCPYPLVGGFFLCLQRCLQVFHISQTHDPLSYWSAFLLSGATGRSASSFQFQDSSWNQQSPLFCMKCDSSRFKVRRQTPWYIIRSQHLASPCNSNWGGFVPYCVSGSVWEDTFGSYNSGYR